MPQRAAEFTRVSIIFQWIIPTDAVEMNKATLEV